MSRATVLIPGISDLSRVLLAQALRVEETATVASDVGPAIRSFDAERSVSANQGKLKAALKANATLSISLLNSASDQKSDATGVFGKASADTDIGINPSPRLFPSAQRGWLKYAFLAEVRAEVAQDLGVASASIEASRQIEYAAYRPHATAQTIADSVAADLASMPTVLEAEEVATLSEGESVSIRIPGKVAFSLDLDETVFASSSLKPIADAFGVSGAVALQFSRGVSFGVDISFEDDTRLVFVGVEGGWIHTSLRKAQTSRFGISLGLNFKLGLSDASRQTLVAETGKAFFGAAEEELTELIESLNAAQLSDNQKALLQRLGVKLEIISVGDALLGAVKQKLTDRKAKLLKALDEILKSRIEMGFKFEYSRVATDGSLFEAVLSPAAIRELHADLLRFDLRRAVALARKKDVSSIRDFFLLHEKSVERTVTLGFTLGFGKWLKISLSSAGKRRYVEQTNHNDEKRCYWISSREIAGSFNDKTGRTLISLRADTENFTAAPTLADLKLSISLDSEQHLGIDELPGLLDLAALWRAFMPEHMDARLSQAKDFLKGQKDYDATISLRVSDRLVRAMAVWLRDHDNLACTPLLARAMPYWKGYAAREIEALREVSYEPIFRDYLSAEGAPLLAQRVRNALHNHHPKLGKAERNNYAENLSFVGYVAKPDSIGHRPIGMRIDALRRACLQILALPTRSAQEMNQIIELFYDQQNVFAQRSFTVRFFGALLAEIAIENGYQDGWQSSLTLSYKKDGETPRLIIGKSGV